MDEDLDARGKKLMALLRDAVDNDEAFDAECRELAQKYGFRVALEIDVEIAIIGPSGDEKFVSTSEPKWEPTAKDNLFLKAMRISD